MSAAIVRNVVGVKVGVVRVGIPPQLRLSSYKQNRLKLVFLKNKLYKNCV